MKLVKQGRIYDVSDTFYHGTCAVPFATFNTPSSFTKSVALAESCAYCGPYFLEPYYGQPRIIHANIETKAVMAYMTKEYAREAYYTRDDKRVRKELHKEYHQHARAMVEGLGLQAYWSDLYRFSMDEELVVLDPDLISIVDEKPFYHKPEFKLIRKLAHLNTIPPSKSGLDFVLRMNLASIYTIDTWPIDISVKL